MPADTNIYGLSRSIPEPIKREIRQRCGFGCVVCGIPIYDYDHFEVEFANAKSHDADKIILLCAVCHARKTRRQLSDKTIRRHAVDPFCKRQGFSFGELDVGLDPPKVVLGTVTAHYVESVLDIDEERVIWIEPPEVTGAPFRISADLKGADGQPLLRIERNEWQCSTNHLTTGTLNGRGHGLRSEVLRAM